MMQYRPKDNTHTLSNPSSFIERYRMLFTLCSDFQELVQAAWCIADFDSCSVKIHFSTTTWKAFTIIHFFALPQRAGKVLTLLDTEWPIWFHSLITCISGLVLLDA